MSLHRPTLAEKLLLAFLAVFSVPVLALALGVGWMFYWNQRHESEKQVLDSLEKTAAAVSQKVEVLESVSATVSGYDSLFERTEIPGPPTSETILEIKDLLVSFDRIQALNPDIVRVRLYVLNDEWPEVWPFLYWKSRVAQEPWAIQNSGRGSWNLGHSDELKFLVDTWSRKDHLVSLYKPVSDAYGQALGGLQVSTTAEAFFSGFFDRQPEGTPTALWTLSTGTILNPTNVSVSPSLASIPNRLHDFAQESGLVEARGTSPEIAWYYLPHLGAVLLSEVPGVAAPTLALAFWGLGLSVLAVLALSLLLSTLGIRLVLRRLEVVRVAVQEVRQGNWDVALPVTGNDEITELTETFRDLLSRLKGLVDGLVQEQMATKDAELRALQSQINAHFLYNALESIRMTAFVDGQDRVSDALAALGKSLRYGMEWDRSIVSLRDEVDHAEAYLLLWNLRFGDVIQWEKDLPADWEGVPICKFILQPLIENSVLHGLAGQGYRGRVRLEGTVDQGHLVLRLKNTGDGLTSEQWSEIQTALTEPSTPVRSGGTERASIGLRNVHERLKQTLGPEAGLVLEGTWAGWTSIRWRIPWKGDQL